MTCSVASRVDSTWQQTLKNWCVTCLPVLSAHWVFLDLISCNIFILHIMLKLNVFTLDIDHVLMVGYWLEIRERCGLRLSYCSHLDNLSLLTD